MDCAGECGQVNQMDDCGECDDSTNTDCIDLSLEYEMSKFEAELVFSDQTTATQEFDVRVIRVGVAYNF
jgi:thioester reductase-like protein